MTAEVTMARLSLQFVLALSVAGLSSAALAAPSGSADDPLAAQAAALRTPSLRTRIQARAAAYRVVLKTAEQLGFDGDAVAHMARTPRAPIIVAARTSTHD